MDFPCALPKGAKVALLSPASPFADGALLDVSVNALSDLGFSPVVYPSAEGRCGYLAAEDALRARDVNRAFADPSISAVFCTRGGYGCMRILPLLDYGMIAQNQKPLIGLSDVTALHLALYRKAGLKGLHAPMPFRYPELPQGAKERLLSLFSGKLAACYTEEDGLFSVCGGRVTAPMLGGNLSLVASLANSEYFPDLAGKILFLEEVGEAEYRVDRLLTSLTLRGVFRDVAGVVFGGFTDCGRPERIKALLRELAPKNVPVLGGFSAGHLMNNHAFYEGQTVTLDANLPSLTFHP